jgi:peptidoglycan hydrolase-like protein with peptidoglycan-binding domain
MGGNAAGQILPFGDGGGYDECKENSMGNGTRSQGNTFNLSRRLPSIETTLGVQRRLNQTGFDAGPEDGIYGPKTTAAVRRFQQFARDNAGGGDPRIIDSGTVDGIAGPITQRALLSFYGS